MLGYAGARRLGISTREGQSSHPTGDITAVRMGFILVGWSAARVPGTLCTGAQGEPAQVEPLVVQPSLGGTQLHFFFSFTYSR